MKNGPANPEWYAKSRDRLKSFLTMPHGTPDIIVAMEAKLMLRRYYGSRWRLAVELFTDWCEWKHTGLQLIPVRVWQHWACWRGQITREYPLHVVGCPHIGRDEIDDCTDRLMPAWLRRLAGVTLDDEDAA